MKNKVFIVAEMGINHNGDIKIAHKMIDEAFIAGADAIKFQNYRTEDFVQKDSNQSKYSNNDYEMFKHCELSYDNLKELKTHCDELGTIFFSTPTSEQGINDLVKLGVKLLKNGSDFIKNLPLIEAMAKTGIPTIISTGMSTLLDIQNAYYAFLDAGGVDLTLLHCVSNYPTHPKDIALKRITLLKNNFDCQIGFSDHSIGNIASIGAVVLGASVIEKHFTLDNNTNGHDQWFSVNPCDFKSLVNSIRTIEESL